MYAMGLLFLICLFVFLMCGGGLMVKESSAVAVSVLPVVQMLRVSAITKNGVALVKCDGYIYIYMCMEKHPDLLAYDGLF